MKKIYVIANFAKERSNIREISKKHVKYLYLRKAKNNSKETKKKERIFDLRLQQTNKFCPLP